MVALTVASSGLAVATESFQITLFPKLAAEADPGRQRDTLAATLRRAVAILSLGILVLIMVVPWLIPFLFGSAFISSIVVTQVLLIAYFPAALRQIAARALKAVGDTGAAAASEGIVIVSFLLIVGPLAWKFDLVGVAIAIFFSNMLSTAYAMRLLSQTFGLRGGHWLTVRAFWELGHAVRSVATRLIARNVR
jgi:O-antigen/teichoic acid export membrane protein